jgi:hypothetical protein
MSKAIQADMIMSSASTRADGSVGLRFSTAKLQPAEKTAFFELLNKNLKVLIQPVDEPVEAMVEVKGVLGFKTPSQRLRNVLFVEWKQHHKDEILFDEFYTRELDRIIEIRKSKLDPE